MAHEEKYGTRDLSYSAWHRRNSTRRFVGIELAQTLHMIDLDSSLFVEYDEETKIPLGLIETAMDVGQPWKTAAVTKNLAEMAGIPAYVVLYKLSESPNPADETQKDIESFRYKRLTPQKSDDWTTCDPQTWANNLVKLRKHSSSRLDAQQ